MSLTTEGDVSAASGLAVERFPVASADGTISYSRTFQLRVGVNPGDIGSGVIVQHGISELFADPTQYDGEPRSSIMPELPIEITIPADCGVAGSGLAYLPESAPDRQIAPQAALVSARDWCRPPCREHEDPCP